MEKIWLKNYPEGIPAEINPDVFKSLVDVFDQSCQKFSSRPAYYNLGVTLTYQQLDFYSRAFAAYLQQTLKLKKGDRIALMMPNILQYPVAMLGALRVGLIVVNVNPLYTVSELTHQLCDAGAETIVVLVNFADVVQQALLKGAPLKHIIITELGDLFPPFKAGLIHFYLKYIKRKIPSVAMPVISFKKIITAGKHLALQPVMMSNEDTAFLQYTGGTTGVSKGAMLSHRNLIANLLQAEAWFNPVFKPGEEIFVTALPLYHIFSLLANSLFVAKIGALSLLITDPRNIAKLVSDIAKFKFSVVTGVNTLFNALVKNPHFAKLNFSSLKVSLGGGAAVQRVVAEKWQAVTGNPIIEAYGLTEAAPTVCINPYNIKSFNGTVGLPASSTDICILDEAGKEVPCGERGELAVKGPQVMQCYWKNPQETANVFTKEGWLLTGDIATLSTQGFISIVERKKDMIIVSGFNVYPNEIEDVLMHMPGILEAAVIGVPDEGSGEAVKACIVKENANLTEEDVRHFCHENLTGYKRPKYIEFYQDLPKTNVGKILRRALRALPSSSAPSSRGLTAGSKLS